jgi:hypothetical protein
MMIRGSILALLAMTVSTGAHAQTTSSVNQARIALRDYAECLVSDYDRPLAGDRDRPIAKEINAFLSTSPTAPASTRAASLLNTDVCVKGRNQTDIDSIRFAPVLLRGALFRAKFLKLERSASESGAFPPYDASAPWHLAHSDSFAILQAIGECTVRENPAQARIAISAGVGSAEESNAYAALVPSLTKCMPQDGTYTFSRARLEGLMAEALYFLSGGTLPAFDARKFSSKN